MERDSKISKKPLVEKLWMYIILSELAKSVKKCVSHVNAHQKVP